MEEHRPRFEFRVWGDDLRDVADRLRSLTDHVETRESSQWYFVVSGVVDVNAKVRAGALDVKVLLTEVDGFEQWDPWINLPFPVGADVLTEQLFPRLRIASPPLGRAMYDAEELVHEVVGPHPEIYGIEVGKRRDMREGRGCIAEVAEVSVIGEETLTVAIESVDIETLAALQHRLGIQDRDNVNYQRALQEMPHLEVR